MPQYTMTLIEESDLAALKDADVIEHKAGAPAKQGGGDETWRCGACKTKLLIDVAHKDAHGAVIRCGKCGRLNAELHHHH